MVHLSTVMSGIELPLFFGADSTCTKEWTFLFKSHLRRGTLLRRKGSGMSGQLLESTLSPEDCAGGKSQVRL